MSKYLQPMLKLLSGTHSGPNLVEEGHRAIARYAVLNYLTYGHSGPLIVVR